jgi:hypothetical protein
LKDAPPLRKKTSQSPTQNVKALIVIAATFSLMINHFAVLHPLPPPPPLRLIAVYAKTQIKKFFFLFFLETVNIEFSRRKILQPKRFAKGKNSYHYKKPIPNIPHPHPFTDHLLHLIQINHGNFPPRQVTRGQRGREGWGCWSGEEGGFRRMMTKIFRIVPCPGSSRKEEGEGGGGY